MDGAARDTTDVHTAPEGHPVGWGRTKIINELPQVGQHLPITSAIQTVCSNPMGQSTDYPKLPKESSISPARPFFANVEELLCLMLSASFVH